MSMEEDYRGLAAGCLDLAKRSHETAEKLHLLAMAEAWLNLADKIARLVKRPSVRVGEHPAVRAALGPEQREAEYLHGVSARAATSVGLLSRVGDERSITGVEGV
jgi:hypothetical protein